MSDMDDLKKMPEDYWKKKLTPEQYNVLREKGTEAPFSGRFYKNFDSGMYECAACGNPLFFSDTKFDSDCGWPSFDSSIDKKNIELKEDTSHGMLRTEVLCKKCGGHLGHVFDDSPINPSASSGHSAGKRFCINSISLNFKPKK